MIVLAENQRRRVRLTVVAAHFREHFAERYAHGNRDADFLPHAPPEQIRQFARGQPVESRRARHVQIRFVNRSRLHEIRIFAENGVHAAGYARVLVVMRRNEEDVWTFLPRLPDGVRRLDTRFLRQFVFRHDDAAAVFRVASDRHRYIPPFRMLYALAGSEKVVAVTVKNQPSRHPYTSFSVLLHGYYSTSVCI